ncbi:Gfo/Idh/MocA family protein [Gluconobacter thailandicus]|uniref:Gfo/Idh/MocA family oxidoreductase n=1 Tax=Gluconobacter thailandicus TaxID=257438 RepID=A0AAP9JH46_GLUTH|nr:Gfo/Idh/MocA family oxidoreductase [Gluconobacter thailandicus]KXV35124.1 oxidoreductase [Gluconobacter thailandicus]QEH95853.1 Gfo/Idh/MocA family oxidoreductase [Gluconobacter thailandicus]
MSHDTPPGVNNLPSILDTGIVENGQISFGNWRGDADVPESQPRQALPPSERVGFAIMGLGRLTLGEILPAFSSCRLAKPVALISGRPEKTRLTAHSYGIGNDSLFTYDDIQRLADRPDIQAVYVVTPNALHAEQVEALAAAGKHVLCEKPMAKSSAEAQRMIAACQKARVKLMIAYRCHYEPFNQAVSKLVQSGELGRPKLVEAINTQIQGNADQWRLKPELAGGGALPDIGLYCLNGTRAVLGEEPESLFAQMISPPNDPRYKDLDETFSFMLRFPSGVMANCATSYGAYESKDLRIQLEKGWITLENAFSYTGHRLRIGQRQGNHKTVNEWRLPAGNQFALEIDHFAHCILNDLTPRTPGEEGLRDQKLMEALYDSARTGRMIHLPRES